MDSMASRMILLALSPIPWMFWLLAANRHLVQTAYYLPSLFISSYLEMRRTFS